MGLFSRKKSNKSAGMTLRGFPADCATNKCLLMAGQKGIALKTELLDLAVGACDGAEYRQLSPFGKVPCLKDGDFVVSGAQAVLAYLDIRGQGGSLNPKKAAILGEQNYWVDVAQRFVDPQVSVLMQPLAPLQADAATQTGEAAIQTAKAEIARVLDGVEAVLADGRRFLVGEYSFADIHWTACLHLCVMSGHEDLIEGHPAIKGWYDRLKTHSSPANRKPTYNCLASLEEIREKRLKSAA